MRSVALSPESREKSLRAMAEEELDILVIGGGVVGAGAALDAATRGLDGRAGRGARLRLRHLEPVQQADPRRPALPGDARLRAGRRGAQGARAAAAASWPRTWCARCAFLYPLQHRCGSGSTPAPGSRSTTRCRGSRAAPGVPLHQHLTRRGRAQAGARRCARTRWSARCSTTTRRSTTPGTRCSSPAPPRRTAPTSPSRARVVELLARGRAGHRRAGARPRDRHDASTIRAKQVVNATGVWTDETQALGGQRGQFHVRASKGVHLVVPAGPDPLARSG